MRVQDDESVIPINNQRQLHVIRIAWASAQESADAVQKMLALVSQWHDQRRFPLLMPLRFGSHSPGWKSYLLVLLEGPSDTVPLSGILMESILPSDPQIDVWHEATLALVGFGMATLRMNFQTGASIIGTSQGMESPFLAFTFPPSRRFVLAAFELEVVCFDDLGAERWRFTPADVVVEAIAEDERVVVTDFMQARYELDPSNGQLLRLRPTKPA